MIELENLTLKDILNNLENKNFSSVDIVESYINQIEKLDKHNLVSEKIFDEAVDLALVLNSRMNVPMHYGMDPGNTVNPQIFVDEIQDRAPEQSYVIPEVGGRILID